MLKNIVRIVKKGLHKVEGFTNGSGSVDVSALCEGKGIVGDEWVLTQELLDKAVLDNFSETTKNLHFNQGEYKTNGKPIKLDFGKIYRNNGNHDEMLKVLYTGVSITGNHAKISVGKQRDEKVPAFWVLWDSAVKDAMSGQINLGQTALFYWKIAGLSIGGDVDNELVRLGAFDEETTAWNSCHFDLICNNGYYEQSLNGKKSPAVGIVVMRALETECNIVAAARHGIGAIFEYLEFSTVKGSFSNGFEETTTKICGPGNAITLNKCVANTFLSMNLEMSYNGLILNNSYGNVFNTVISNNQDNRGTTIIDNTNNKSDEDNVFHSVIIRSAINGGYPTKSNKMLKEAMDKVSACVSIVLPIITISCLIYILTQYKYVSKKQRIKGKGKIAIGSLVGLLILFSIYQLYNLIVFIMNSLGYYL